MVSVLVSWSSGLGSSPGRGHCVVFLGKTLHSRSPSIHPATYMSTSEINAGGNPAMDQNLIQGGVEIWTKCHSGKSKGTGINKHASHVTPCYDTSRSKDRRTSLIRTPKLSNWVSWVTGLQAEIVSFVWILFSLGPCELPINGSTVVIPFYLFRN